MNGVWVGLACVFGAVIGSFLNVVIYRVPRGESVVRPSSHCPACGSPIRAWHNVPVLSFLALRGRCSSCHAPISLRYPLVEAATAVLFGVTVLWALDHGAAPAIPVLLYLGAIGLALAMIDIDVHRLPDALVLPSYLVVGVLLTAAAAITGDWWSLARAGIGAAALFTFYFLLAFVYPAGMGFGDVKLAGVLGGVLGYFGFGAVIVGAFAGFVLGAIVAVVLLLLRRGTRKTALPFGPFMLLGFGLGVVAGSDLAGAYWLAVAA